MGNFKDRYAGSVGEYNFLHTAFPELSAFWRSQKWRKPENLQRLDANNHHEKPRRVSKIAVQEHSLLLCVPCDSGTQPEVTECLVAIPSKTSS
jgi:hypothetical protein